VFLHSLPQRATERLASSIASQVLAEWRRIVGLGAEGVFISSNALTEALPDRRQPSLCTAYPSRSSLHRSFASGMPLNQFERADLASCTSLERLRTLADFEPASIKVFGKLFAPFNGYGARAKETLVQVFVQRHALLNPSLPTLIRRKRFQSDAARGLCEQRVEVGKRGGRGLSLLRNVCNSLCRALAETFRASACALSSENSPL